MRISTARFFQTTIDSIHNQQSKLLTLQQQLGSGRRVLNPSDDPAAATRSLVLDKILDEYRQYERNTGMAESKLTLEENAIGSTEDMLQRVRELAVYSSSQLNSQDERNAIASEVDELLNQILDISNYRDGNNEFIFAGFQSKIKPFARDNLGVVSYNGDQGQRELNIGTDVRVAVGDPGSRVFQTILNGNGVFSVDAVAANTGTGIIGEGSVAGGYVSDTYSIVFTRALATDPITYTVTGATSGVVANGTYATTAQLDAGEHLSTSFSFNGVLVEFSGQPADGDTFTVAPSQHQDIFTTVRNLVDALRISGDSDQQKTKVSNGINRSLSDLNRAMDNLITVRTELGARRKTVESQQTINSEFNLEVSNIQSSLMDLDFPEAISSMNRELLSLQAAQSTFARMQDLSIFNFLR